MSAANNLKASVQDAPSLSSDQILRILRVITMAVVGAAIVTMLLYLIAAIRWQSQTFSGFMTSYTLVVDGNRAYGSEQWAGQVAGIQRLDRITQVEGVTLPTESYRAARAALREAFNGQSYGDTVEVGFVRPTDRAGATADICNTEAAAGGYVPCSVSYTLAPLPQEDFLAYFVFPYVTALIALIVGITLLAMRPTQTNALLVVMFCATLAVFSGGLFDNATSHMAVPIWLAFTSAGSAVVYLVALTFPKRPALTYRQPVLLAVPPVAGAALALITLYLYFNPGSAYGFTRVWQMPTAAAFSGFILLLLSLVIRRRYTTSSIQRDKINTGLIGIGLAVVPVMLWVLSNVALFVDSSLRLPFNSATMIPFFISIPVSMAYATLQYNRESFNTDAVISQGITYGIMLGALVVGYFFVVMGVKLFTQDIIQSDNPFIVATTIFVIAVAFLPVRTRLQGRIDAIYYRTRRNFQARAESFGREVSTTRDFKQILTLYVAHVREALNPPAIFIFLPNDEDGSYSANPVSHPGTDIAFPDKGAFVELLNKTDAPIRIDNSQRWQPALVTEKGRLGILKADLIVPLRSGRDQISGFVIVSQPNGERGRYSYEELRYLDTVSSQMAVSAERAQVIDSLERRVRELGVLSQVSQAVNFAVEFDDLLELVSAQTQKVLEAPNFYIALRDNAAGQIYYAFFMEYNERNRVEEKRRWPTGNDIYTYISDESQPTRLGVYSQAITSRHLEPRGITDETQAWMGVPLIAGQTRLGVIAIGTSRRNYTYSDEQLRIFSDIGALAATSLDKARLFEETNKRARQLRALNDIARRLQAERKVETLIPLITSSAVNILEAEAGSLLLQAEDGSGDMEFRIVVGGSGQDLIGTRVKAGHGIVGEVAETGAPVIVNNTREDLRWEGEASSNETFQTESVLAVPLIVEGEVVGVLEVLNKTDGTAYNSEDADVLETFAGQAAIAIDNARLLQMTDKQLSLRVQELETLEKIDAELNKALDLERVAEVTVKWAIANTGASAGLLGLVAEETPPTHMRLLHTYGYQQEDLQDVLDEQLLPLDRGIVSRVIRTKQPDIQADVNLDPDYVPSLRSSNSQITVPIMAGKVIIAILILEKNVRPTLSLLDLAFVQRLTEHAAIAIENARLVGELEMIAKAQSKYMGEGAHELKNALSPVKGWADLLLSGVMGQMTDKQQDSLNVIKSNVSRAQLIIQDLRDFAKMRAHELSINPEPTSIRNVVVETLRPYIKQFEEKDQTLINHIINKDLPDIVGDSQRLIQVMTNFISNAIKYSPEGATITLDANVGTSKDNRDNLIISIADTGMGMSAEDQKRIGQPYFRTKRAEESEIPGTGLGMSLTKEIIIQHGGKMWLESELNTGTTFFFSLPIAKQDTTVSEPASD